MFRKTILSMMLGLTVSFGCGNDDDSKVNTRTNSKAMTQEQEQLWKQYMSQMQLASCQLSAVYFGGAKNFLQSFVDQINDVTGAFGEDATGAFGEDSSKPNLGINKDQIAKLGKQMCKLVMQSCQTAGSFDPDAYGVAKCEATKADFEACLNELEEHSKGLSCDNPMKALPVLSACAALENKCPCHKAVSGNGEIELFEGHCNDMRNTEVSLVLNPQKKFSINLDKFFTYNGTYYESANKITLDDSLIDAASGMCERIINGSHKTSMKCHLPRGLGFSCDLATMQKVN